MSVPCRSDINCNGIFPGWFRRGALAERHTAYVWQQVCASGVRALGDRRSFPRGKYTPSLSRMAAGARLQVLG